MQYGATFALDLVRSTVFESDGEGRFIQERSARTIEVYEHGGKPLFITSLMPLSHNSYREVGEKLSSYRACSVSIMVRDSLGSGDRGIPMLLVNLGNSVFSMQYQTQTGVFPIALFHSEMIASAVSDGESATVMMTYLSECDRESIGFPISL